MFSIFIVIFMDTDIYITKPRDCVSNITLQKMYFLYNALNDGWEIKMKNNKYHFKKKHQDEKEIYLDSYLADFIKKNMNS